MRGRPHILLPAVLLPAITGTGLQPNPAALRQLFVEELARRKTEYGESDPRTAQSARDLGLFLRNQGDTARARRVLAEVVRVDEKSLGPNAARTLADIADLASVSPPGEADRLWQLAARSPDAVVASRALASLAHTRENAGEWEQAIKLYRQALAKEEEAEGPEGARIPARLNALAQVVDLPEGITLLERAAAISRRRLGTHQETASLNLNLALLLLKAGQPEKAVQPASEAWSALEDSPGAARAATILANVLRLKGDAVGAERMYRRAMAIDRQAYGPLDARTLADARALTGFLREIGKHKEAQEVDKQLVNGPR